MFLKRFSAILIFLVQSVRSLKKSLTGVASMFWSEIMQFQQL